MDPDLDHLRLMAVSVLLPSNQLPLLHEMGLQWCNIQYTTDSSNRVISTIRVTAHGEPKGHELS